MNTDDHKPKELIPDFDSYVELGEFWDSHSLADYWDQTEEAQLESDPAQRRMLSEVKPMAVQTWTAIRAKRFTPEEIEAIQKTVDEELPNLDTGRS